MSAKIVLANIDYESSPLNEWRGGHTSTEGMELQRGLEQSGWTLAGFGYGDGCVDVPTLLKRHDPSIVFISAREDWDEHSPGCFDKRCSFQNIGVLADRPDIFKVSVVKDSPGAFDRRKAWCEEIKADAVVLYYHEQSMLQVSPWLSNYRMIRTYHSVDADLLAKFSMGSTRKRGIVTGAIGEAYPVRQRAVEFSNTLGIDELRHPGYNNRGSFTPGYLAKLTTYKVHLATASRYGFALRKIVESVVCGCTCVTTLPDYDVLPVIDPWLVRISEDAQTLEIKEAIDRAESSWDMKTAIDRAKAAREFYDYRASGKRLDVAIAGMMQSGKSVGA